MDLKFKFKKIVGATALYLISMTVPAYADPAIMFGLSYNFGSGAPRFGATTKLLSSDEPNEVVAAAGVTYFFDDNSIGWDAGLGYTFDGGVVTLSYDFTHQEPQISVGLGDIKEPVRHTVC
jgi:hypothetical protein